MLRVTVLERGRLLRGDPDTSGTTLTADSPARRILPAPLYDRLYRHETAREDRGEAPVFQWRRNHCLVGPWVGVLQIPGLQLEILPKTDDDESGGAGGNTALTLGDVRSNLMEMLVRGGLAAVRARGVADLALRAGNLHDQLVDAFLDRALFEYRRGPDRGYLSQEDNLDTLRGKLVLSRHLARNNAQKHRFYCRHDVLSEATLINIRIKQACGALGFRPLPVSTQSKRQLLMALLDEVPDVPVQQHEPDPTFTRQNERFEDIYTFASMLLAGLAPDARAGQVETFSLLFDMDQVFERYIAAFLLSRVIPHIEGARLFPQARGHRYSLYRAHNVSDREGVLRLAPDLLFALDTPPGSKTLIIDTKWKRLSDGVASRPANNDLYQLYAYLHRYDCDRAFLLYPQVGNVEPRDLEALSGRNGDSKGTVGVRFVNLRHRLWTNAGRAALAQQLDTLVREGFGLTAAPSSAVASMAGVAP